MRNGLRKVKNILAVNLKLDTLYGRKSFSQEGEDLILQKIFNNKGEGFYVDVGAHHPFRYSNSYLLYKKGWSGINIDAAPESMNSFNKVRPRDINLETGVSDKTQTLSYYVFKDSALNTFSKPSATAVINSKQSSIEKIIKVKTKPLKEILSKHLPYGEAINLLNVDTEGYDLKVLKSNDWKRYFPVVIVVEIGFTKDMNEALNTPISKFLLKKGYILFAKTVNSALFIHQNTKV